MKSIGKLVGLLGILQGLGLGEGRGTAGEGVKSYNPSGTTCGVTYSNLLHRRRLPRTGPTVRDET